MCRINLWQLYIHLYASCVALFITHIGRCHLGQLIHSLCIPMAAHSQRLVCRPPVQSTPLAFALCAKCEQLKATKVLQNETDQNSHVRCENGGTALKNDTLTGIIAVNIADINGLASMNQDG